MTRIANDTVEERLNSALAAIRRELATSHEDLTGRLDQTGQQMNKLLSLVSSGAGAGSNVSADVATERLSHTISERDLSLAATTKHTAELEAALAELKSEIAQLRSRESWIVAANQDLSERLVVLRADEKQNSKILAKANEDINRLTEALAEREQTLEDARKSTDFAKKNLCEARLTAKNLMREVAGLRRENERLRKALETSDSYATMRERQQRIMIEALIANGQVKKLGEILMSAEILTAEQLADALDEQAACDRMLGEILISKGHVEEEDVAQTIAGQMRLPMVLLDEQTVRQDAARLVDAELCRTHACIPIRQTTDTIFVAMANPRDEQAVKAMENATGRRAVAVVATLLDVQAAIGRIFCP